MRNSKKRIVPAVLTDNPKKLKEMLHQAEGFASWVQIDIMDGLFVPSRSITAKDIVDAATFLNWEAHLMVKDPEKYLDDFQSAGCSRIIVHYEAVKNRASDVIRQIQVSGMEAGLALNPETDIRLLDESLVSKLDAVLFMAVNPGYYGAPFIPAVLQKISAFRKKHVNLSIGIDGGVKLANIQEITQCGVDDICVGSAIFAQKDMSQAYHELWRVANG